MEASILRYQQDDYRSLPVGNFPGERPETLAWKKSNFPICPAQMVAVEKTRLTDRALQTKQVMGGMS